MTWKVEEKTTYREKRQCEKIMQKKDNVAIKQRQNDAKKNNYNIQNTYTPIYKHTHKELLRMEV